MAEETKCLFLDGLPRLSGEYNRGYTRAIMDIINIVDYVNNDLLFHNKRLNYKLVKELLGIILQYRGELRDAEMGLNAGFIRYNHKLKCFEFFDKNKNVGGNR